MHGARSGRGAGETRAACCWKFANLAAISRPLWIRYRCRSSRTQPATPLAATLVVPSGRQPPLLSPDPLCSPPPHRVVVRDPRLTRARPLFSTRWSFVDAFLFVIPFVIPLPLFVARCRALLTLSLSDRESWPIKPAGDRSTRARESRDDDRNDGHGNVTCARYKWARLSPMDRISRKNVRSPHAQ